MFLIMFVVLVIGLLRKVIFFIIYFYVFFTYFYVLFFHLSFHFYFSFFFFYWFRIILISSFALGDTQCIVRSTDSGKVFFSKLGEIKWNKVSLLCHIGKTGTISRQIAYNLCTFCKKKKVLAFEAYQRKILFFFLWFFNFLQFSSFFIIFFNRTI